MSLTYDLNGIENYEKVCLIDGKVSDVTTVITFATMNVGIRNLTAENAPEFYARLKVAEKLLGYFIVDGKGKGIAITWEMVEAHIGLSTNASSKTRTQFLSDMKDELKRILFMHKSHADRRNLAKMA
jgi:hypothetical protein